MNVEELISTVGVALILGVYMLRRRPWMTATLHATGNAVGAGLAAIGSALIGFVPFLVLESVWCLVSLRELAIELRRPPLPAMRRLSPQLIPPHPSPDRKD
ncbi:MAG: hypothetical protein RI958_797 [Actinomycetota bacterium]